ncbi:MAG: hypothetical protein RIR70_1952 [Pseudomonadota bacterium]|jgi:membrane protein YqaA with SNARE-associated domain
MLDFSFNAEWGLAGLFIASFLSATLLPGGSEAALFATLRAYPDHVGTSLMLATLGNTLGGMVSYLCGRLIRTVPARLSWLQRYGSAALLLSWVPLVGDALCVAAGWLRLNWMACLLWMGAGKGLRYLAVIGLERLA